MTETAPPATTTTVKPSRKQWRLKTLLTVPFVALILLPALVIALSSLYTGLKAVDSLSSRVITDVSSRAELAAIHQLEEATLMLRGTVPDPEDSLGSNEYIFRDVALLERKLFEMSAETRTTGYFFYGAADGTFVGVDRGRPGAKAAATVRLRGSEDAPRRIYSARAPGDRSRLIEVESRIFDARKRPWFEQAKQLGRLTWTPIYVSFASGALVTTASQPVVNSEGTLLGVLAADVELTELSTFMKTVAVSENGVAFIVDKEGYLVASSSPGLPFITANGTQSRIKVSEIQNEVERTAAMWWSRERDSLIVADAAFVSRDAALLARSAKVKTASGEAIDVASQRIRGVQGVEWDVVVAIPRSDLTAPIVRSAALMFTVIVVALIAALQLGLWIVSRISRDVEELALAADSYGRTVNDFIAPESRLRETSVLSTAFAGMLDRLKASLTTIREQNEDLAALNSTLEGRVVSRTRQLESKNFELSAEVDRRKRLEADLRSASEAATAQADNKVRFMAMLGHELRTPLQAVISTSELIRRGEGDARAHTDTLRAASHSLLTLVDGVLTYAKLEAGRVDPEYAVFSIREAVDEAVRVATAARAESGAAIESEFATDVPMSVESDRGILRQILINLVGNSLRHVPNGKIRICVSRGPASAAAKQADSRAFSLCISVIDNGPGIPQALRNKLFQPFQQIGRSSADPSQGSGLGLAICALLARALDGDIMLVDDGVPGTRIDFAVHALDATGGSGGATVAALTSEPPVTESQQVLGASEPINILLVEDHPINRKLLSELLVIDHHRVVTAESGEAAVSMVKRALGLSADDSRDTIPWDGACDLVLMDLNLPGWSGLETVTEIRALYARDGLREPIYVALSASAREEVRADCERAGVSEFLSKPATLEQLREVVSVAINRKAEVDTADKPGTVPILDTTTLSQLRELEKKSQKPFVDGLIADFLITLENDSKRLSNAIELGDERKIRQEAHALAGAALSVGAKRLSALCKQANIGAVELAATVEQTSSALREWVGRANDGTTE